MYAWRIVCKKADGTPYLVRYRAGDAQMARQLAMADGHIIELSVQPELIPERIEDVRAREPGEVGAAIAVALAIIGVLVPLLAVAAAVVGAQAASDSRGQRGWVGLVIGVIAVVGWQIAARAH